MIQGLANEKFDESDLDRDRHRMKDKVWGLYVNADCGGIAKKWLNRFSKTLTGQPKYFDPNSLLKVTLNCGELDSTLEFSLLGEVESFWKIRFDKQKKCYLFVGLWLPQISVEIIG